MAANKPGEAHAHNGPVISLAATTRAVEGGLREGQMGGGSGRLAGGGGRSGRVGWGGGVRAGNLGWWCLGAGRPAGAIWHVGGGGRGGTG